MGKLKFKNSQQVKPNSKAPKFAKVRFDKYGAPKVKQALGNGNYLLLWADGIETKVQGSHYDTVTQVSEDQFNEAKKVLEQTEIHELVGKTVTFRDLGFIYTSFAEQAIQMGLEAYRPNETPELGSLGVVVGVKADVMPDCANVPLIAAVMQGDKGYLIDVDGLEVLTQEMLDEATEKVVNEDIEIPEEKNPLKEAVQKFISEQNKEIEKIQSEIAPQLAQMTDRALITVIASEINDIPSPKVYKLMNQLISINPDLANEEPANLYNRAAKVLENTLS